MARVIEPQWHRWYFAQFLLDSDGNWNWPYLNEDNRKRYVNLTWNNDLLNMRNHYAFAVVCRHCVCDKVGNGWTGIRPPQAREPRKALWAFKIPVND